MATNIKLLSGSKHIAVGLDAEVDPTHPDIQELLRQTNIVISVIPDLDVFDVTRTDVAGIFAFQLKTTDPAREINQTWSFGVPVTQLQFGTITGSWVILELNAINPLRETLRNLFYKYGLANFNVKF